MTAAVRLREADATLLLEVPRGWVALSSASVGGGLTRPRWVVNLGVGDGFARTDLDAVVAERLTRVGATGGPVTALLTAADVGSWTGGGSGGVRTWATVAATKPTWAVRPGDPADDADARPPTDDDAPPGPGTVNIVVAVPVALTASALVQAAGTVVEARAQALLEAGLPGTGTASDALVVLCPDPGGVQTTPGERAPVPFAGVRSPWGRCVARSVHQAVTAGMRRHPWPQVAAAPGQVW